MLRLSKQRVDVLVRRFHADRRRVSRNNAYDVAAVFVGTNGALDRTSIEAFRRASANRPFAPFDVTAVPFGHCYVLRAGRHATAAVENAFDPYYCIGGCPQRAVRHYRIDFEALLRLLFFNGFRYVMKPIVVDRCLTASQPL